MQVDPGTADRRGVQGDRRQDDHGRRQARRKHQEDARTSSRTCKNNLIAQLRNFCCNQFLFETGRYDRFAN